MEPERSIWHLTDPYGAPRFYPPGSHPATYRLRETLKRIEALGSGDGPEAEYMREQIAMFEEGESIAKCHAASRL